MAVPPLPFVFPTSLRLHRVLRLPRLRTCSAMSSPTPAAPDQIFRCTHYIPRKRRICGRQCPPPSSASQPPLCGMHLPHILHCPHCHTTLRPSLLPKHTDPANPLCPVLRRHQALLTQPWYKPLCNRPSPPPPSSTPPSTSDILPLIIATLHRYHIHPTPSWVPTSTPAPTEDSRYVEALWAHPRNSAVRMQRKHFEQIRALATVLLHPPFHAPLAVVDLAAGRAYAALYIAHALARRSLEADFVVVDRGATKGKADKLLRSSERPDFCRSVRSFRRLRCDLAHFSMSGCRELVDAQDVRVVGKHVCGVALDMALRAVVAFAKGRRRGSVTIVFATCCRALCCYEVMGGRVLQEWRVGEGAFNHVCRMAAWGLAEHADDHAVRLGAMSRTFVDLARVEWLRREGWDAHIGKYTDATVGSPENACIVAVWNGEQ